jgi:hypothetical protein
MGELMAWTFVDARHDRLKIDAAQKKTEGITPSVF